MSYTHANFGLEDRNRILKNYWAIQNIDLQRQFIHGPVTKTEIKWSTRTKTKFHVVQIPCVFPFCRWERSAVSKKFYLATLGIKQDVVFGAIRKLTDSGAVVADMRGTHKNHPTLDQNIVQDIRDHIKSLSRVPFHFCRKSSSKQYINIVKGLFQYLSIAL